MPPYSRNHHFNIRRKDRLKKISVILQLVILTIVIVFTVRAIFILSSFEELPEEKLTNTEGFVALSYFGVDRNGSPKHISKNELKKQLSILKKLGFETISQQQIMDFYEKGTPLPEKALYLSFEDGRTDSSIFSQGILEKLNYKATMFTYADKMGTTDSKFLKPSHLKAMIDSGYWELGSNGYRLTYTNIFNEKGQYLGEIEENDVSDKTMIEYYNHYLMDYLRDEYMIPKETRLEMQQRVMDDYKKMEEVYTKHFKKMPTTYAIMHANSMNNTMNVSVQEANELMIHELFSIHINKDLNAYNRAEADIYNLNRLQVDPHWSVNHLLMKIESDSSIKLTFEDGEEEVASRWSITDGFGEFQGTNIILTSQPNKEMKATLKDTLPSSFNATLKLLGGVTGKQYVYIESVGDETQIKLVLIQNKLYVYSNDEQEKQLLLFVEELDEIDWSGKDYAFNKATQYSYLDTQKELQEDKDQYPSTLRNDRYIRLNVEGSHLQIEIDDKLIREIPISNHSTGYKLSLGGEWNSRNSQEKYKDTIYDSVFGELEIKSKEKTIYSTEDTELESFYGQVTKWSSEIIDFFIENF